MVICRGLLAARFKAVRGMHAAVIVTAIVLVVVTAALALAPQLHLGYPQEAADLALDTAASVIGLLACFLVFGRLRRRTRLNELLLAGALAVLALANLFLCTVPVVAGWAPDDLTVWLAPVAISFGALLFVLAAFLPDRRLRPSGPLLVVGAGAVTHSAAGDHDFRPRARSLIAAAGGGFPGVRLVHPPRSPSGAVRPAARGGGAVRRGRHRVPAVFAAAAVTSSSAGWPSPPCWLRRRR